MSIESGYPDREISSYFGKQQWVSLHVNVIKKPQMQIILFLIEYGAISKNAEINGLHVLSLIH